MLKKLIICISFIIILHKNSYGKEVNEIKLKNYKYCSFANLKATIFGFKIYDISVCNNKKRKLSYSEIYNNNFSLSIKYNIDISAKKLAESSIKEIKKYNNLKQEEIIEFSNILSKIFVNVSKKDIIIAKYLDEMIYFSYNDKYIGEIKSKKFSKIFLDIWLSPKNNYKKVRKNLVKY